MKLTANSANSRVGFFRFWSDRFSSGARNRQLISQLVKLRLTQQYKRTFLGSVWIVFGPLLGIAIWLVLNYSGVYKPGETSIPYAGYLLLSMSIWIFFTNFYKLIATCVSESGRMLMEVPLNMEAKIMERIMVAIVNFIIPFTLNIILLLILGVDFSFQSLLFFPTLIPLILVGISFGVFVSLIEVVFNDIYIIASQGLTLLMYFTPVVYTNNVDSPFLQSAFKYNPLTYLLSVPRDLLIGAPINNWANYWISAGLALVLFIIVIQFFFKSYSKIVERIFE